MRLLPRAQHADLELWRAVHEQPIATPQRSEVPRNTPGGTLHGMPADRLAMAASRWSLDGRTSER